MNDVLECSSGFRVRHDVTRKNPQEEEKIESRARRRVLINTERAMGRMDLT
jgi:hypothetical protein